MGVSYIAKKVALVEGKQTERLNLVMVEGKVKVTGYRSELVTLLHESC